MNSNQIIENLAQEYYKSDACESKIEPTTTTAKMHEYYEDYRNWCPQHEIVSITPFADEFMNVLDNLSEDAFNQHMGSNGTRHIYEI